MSGFWQGRRCLIVGVDGFLGGHLAKRLVAEGAKVVGASPYSREVSSLKLLGVESSIEHITNANVADLDAVQRVFGNHATDICFHLAAVATLPEAAESPLTTFEVNVKGTWNVLEAARRCSTIGAVIVASSDKAYGSHKRLPYKEEFKLQGMHPYDASKSCLDILSQMYFHTYGLPVGISRCANIYGPGDLNFSRIIPDTMRALILNKRPIIRSDGKFVRDYIFVKDAVESYLTLAENLDRKEIQGEAFNFGNQRPINVLNLVGRIIVISGKKNLKPKILSTAKYEIKEQYLDSKKAQDLLKWRPKYSLDEGLQQTYAWYKRHLKGKAK